MIPGLLDPKRQTHHGRDCFFGLGTPLISPNSSIQIHLTLTTPCSLQGLIASGPSSHQINLTKITVKGENLLVTNAQIPLSVLHHSALSFSGFGIVEPGEEIIISLHNKSKLNQKPLLAVKATFWFDHDVTSNELMEFKLVNDITYTTPQ